MPASAHDYLQHHLAKAEAGAGSRGGHIIGTTRSGKPIYASTSASVKHVRTGLTRGSESGNAISEGSRLQHPKYTAQDHHDAFRAHEKDFETKRNAGKAADTAQDAALGHRIAATHMRQQGLD